MNRKAVRAAAALALIAALSLSAAPPPASRGAGLSQAESPLVVKARAFLDALMRGDFEAAAKDFDATMLKVSGPGKLAEFWSALPEKLGELKGPTGAVRTEKLGEYDIVLLGLKFDRAELDLRVVFDRSGKLGGFQFVPSGPPVPYNPPGYADPGAFLETEATVGSGEWALPGTLTVPKGPGPFPALVLVHGSGPNDRDETIGPNKPFKDLAWGLASRGIAVLRYEKRTRMHGQKMVAEPALAASLTVREETVADAVAAVRLLKSADGIDPDRVFVLGHSLGGYLVPRMAAAAAAADLKVAGWVVMAGLTRPLGPTILEQMTYLLRLDGALSESDEAQLAEIRKQIERIDALAPSDLGSDERILSASPAYWLDLRDYRPAEAAKAIDVPLLILQGGRDYQVTTVDFEAWKEALAGRGNVRFELYPRLNHLFAAGEGPATPTEYLYAHGSVAPEVIEDIAGFIERSR